MVNVRKNDFIETGIRPNNAINTDKTSLGSIKILWRNIGIIVHDPI